MSKIIIDNLDKLHINRAELIKNGFSGQKYDDVLRGKSSYKIDDLILISEKFQLSLDAIILGKEKSPSAELTADEQELLTYYKGLDVLSKGRVLGKAETLAENLAEQRKEQTIKSPISFIDDGDNEDPEIVQLTYFYMPVSAGTGVPLIGDSESVEISVPVSDNALNSDFIVRISGDSMKPAFNDGDRVFVQSAPSIDCGEIGVFSINGSGYIKKYSTDRLISLNKNYDDILFSECDDIRCFGRVLGVVDL